MTPEKMVPFKYVATDLQLERFLDEVDGVSWVGYDTEFISEGRYIPELCLVQVATETGVYLLDPLSIRDLNPFWDFLCRDGVTSIAHACHSELEFCFRAVGRFPSKIFDVQLAAAFVGYGYPLNFKTLASETVGVNLAKAETLTDWKRRPLLNGQLRYALNDVCHLKKIADFLKDKLETERRVDWFAQETGEMVEALRERFTEENWRKISGSRLVDSNELAIQRELWRWRREKALAKNIPPGRVLRDDVLINLAKLRVADPESIATLRGVRGTSGSQQIQEIAKVIRFALDLPENEKPKAVNNNYPTYKLATQLVGVLVAQFCHHRQISYQVVATSSDIRRAIAQHEGVLPETETCRLSRGWRLEFLGSFLNNVLNGRYAMQLTGNLDDEPLRLIDVGGVTTRALHDA